MLNHLFRYRLSSIFLFCFFLSLSVFGKRLLLPYQNGNEEYVSVVSVDNLSAIKQNNYIVSFTGHSYLTPTASLVPFGATFSISGWFKPKTGDVRCIASFCQSKSWYASSSLQIDKDNYLYYIQNNGNVKRIRCNKRINNDMWTHISLVKNQNTIKFYINGVEASGSYVAGSAPMNNNTVGDNFRFGIMNEGNNDFRYGWKGEMDNLTFYSTARSAASVKSEFLNGINKTEEGIWGAWTFNDLKIQTQDSSLLAVNHLALTDVTYKVSDLNEYISASPIAPTLSTENENNTSASVYFESPSGGTMYWALYPSASIVSDANAIKNGTGALQKGNLFYITQNAKDYVLLKSLAANTSYTLYSVTEGYSSELHGIGKLSEISSISFSTTNTINGLTNEILGVKGLLSRLLPEHANNFEFASISKNGSNNDVFELSSVGGKILVKGSSGTALTSGINHYLHNYCNASFSWNGDQTTLPATLPSIAGTIRKETPYAVRYSLNYCTLNYTMSFWDWNRWEREIDIMAMNGINVFLSTIGSEAVWQKTLQHFGYTFSEIQNFIPGPAYTGWWMMGNLEGDGGKVSQEYINSRTELQKKIIERAKQLDMDVVLQGFVGLVPSNFKTKVPSAILDDQGWWYGHRRPSMVLGNYCDSVAKYWYQESVKLFGASNYYGGDAFHEGGRIPKTVNLRDYAGNLQKWMMRANPKAVWILQAWGGNPEFDFLSGLKKDQCLVVDLGCERDKLYRGRSAYWSYPWTFSVINNFGGRMGIYAHLQEMATDVYNLQKSTTSTKGNLVGIGTAPEAIIYNTVSYDIMWDLVWESSHINTNTWIAKYADRRYGLPFDNTQKAWQILNGTALACTNRNLQGGTGSVINARPSLTATTVSTWSEIQSNYDPVAIIPAWTHMMNSVDVLTDKTTFKYDLVDITRQALTNFANQTYTKMVASFNTSNRIEFAKYSDLFLEIMLDQDSLLRTREEFLLGKWIADARAMGTSAAESNLFEENARSLLTVWSARASDEFKEYANREWAGLTKDFYRERWKLFINDLTGRLNGKAPQNINFRQVFEYPWCKKRGGNFDVIPTGKEIEMSTYIYNKYLPLMGYSLTNMNPVVLNQTFTIAEKQAIGALVGNVAAVDPNPGQILIYGLYSQSVPGAFAINSATGRLTVASASAMDAAINPTITVMLKATDNGSPSYSVYRKITVNLTAVTALNDVLNLNKPICFPNPAKNFLYLKSPDGFQDNIRIFDLSGKLMSKEKVTDPTIVDIALPIDNFVSGSYFVSFKSNNDEEIKLKFTK